MVAFQQKITTITTDLTNTYADYNETAAYNSGDKVTDDGFYYELIPSTATGKKPSENPLYWQKIGVANKESIIDLRSTTKSEKTGGFYVEFPVNYDYNYLAIGYYSAYKLKVEELNDLDEVVKTYLDETVSINENVFDLWDYVYEPYSTDVDRTVFFKLHYAGTKIRVTFESNVTVPTPYCGFVLSGRGVNLGKTKSNVSFNLNSYSTRNVDEFGIMTINKKAVQNLVDFETTIKREEFMLKRSEIKRLYDEFCCFILAENNEDSTAVGIGVMQDATQLYNEYDESVVGYSIIEAI